MKKCYTKYTSSASKLKCHIPFFVVIIFLFGSIGYGEDFSVRFNKMKAYEHLVNQCDFGPRVPGSEAHKECLKYIKENLEKNVDKIELQEFKQYSALLGKEIDMTNIIGLINPDKKRRICLSGHWDSRPIAEKDPEHKDRPILGANDGASSTAVLLELARVLGENKPDCGVMIIFFDCEDMGFDANIYEFCLGSQYFAKNALEKYPFDFGINIDMIGDADLVIKKETFSMSVAKETVNRLWEVGQSVSKKSFSNKIETAVYDDNVPFIKKGKKYINLIDFDYKYWHTLEDTPDKCSPESLNIVGKTLLRFIYDDFCKN